MKQFVVALLFVALPLVKPNVCPDGSMCPGAYPCCPSSSGYKCCPSVGGNCCSDGNYCCAAGYICIPGLDICILPFSSNNNHQDAEEVAAISKKESKINQCPSGMTECGETPSGVECCPFPNAVCCSDGAHCCPEGYTCDLPDQECVKNVALYNTMKSNPAKKMQRLVYSDGTETVALAKKINGARLRQCPQGMTECGETPSGVECCPFPNAVCCSDGAHCCPEGYTCDLPDQECVKNVHYLYPIVNKVKMGRALQP